MTRKQRQRRIDIIKQLSDLSRDGWRLARHEDWEPLERELREMDR